MIPIGLCSSKIIIINLKPVRAWAQSSAQANHNYNWYNNYCLFSGQTYMYQLSTFISHQINCYKQTFQNNQQRPRLACNSSTSKPISLTWSCVLVQNYAHTAFISINTYNYNKPWFKTRYSRIRANIMPNREIVIKLHINTARPEFPPSNLYCDQHLSCELA